MAEALTAGVLPSDATFDGVYARRLQLASSMHWTPLDVIARVARWIDEHGIRSVVDVGAGPGKLCVAGALLSRASFVGIEHRPWLVEAARELAEAMGVAERARFVCAAVTDGPLPVADAYYVFNPFGENLLAPGEGLAQDVELGTDRHRRDVTAMRRAFERAPLGTWVIAYNGLGGRMPPCYGEMASDRSFSSPLKLWRKDVEVLPPA